MRASSFTPSLVILAATLGLLAGPLACAQAVRTDGDEDDGGEGGEGGEGPTASGGGDAGTDAPPGPCVFAEDCAALSDACNVGTCINGMCAKSPANDFALCDDGQFCTKDDTCQGGQCVGGGQIYCPSGADTCHIGACDEATDSCTLVPGNDGAQCVDDDPCTSIGFCSGGLCSPGPQIDCSFLEDECGTGACDPELGCVKVPKPDGTLCSDGLFCTINDACASGVCGGQPNTCAAPGDVCLVGTCNEAAKTCVAVPGNNGAVCDDQSACTAGEVCNNGTCAGGAPANQGGACNDKNACTSNDTCNNGQCAGTAVLACQNGDGCCPTGCDFNNDDDCKLLNVGVMGGSFYTDTLRSYLASQPFIQSAVTNSSCSPADLSQFDVVIVYGNMDCFDPVAFNEYTQNGGGLIGTPWIFNNYSGLDCLPVNGSLINTNFMAPLNVQVTDPNDVLLQGVNFVNGDLVGWEEWNFALKPGATSSVVWNQNPSYHAVAKWDYGSGRAVYLDFHYITSDCSLAIDYNWGKKLIYNATLWAGKAL